MKHKNNKTGLSINKIKFLSIVETKKTRQTVTCLQISSKKQKSQK